MNPEKEKQITRAMKKLIQTEPRLNLNEVRIIVAIERAIARLSTLTELAEHLIFKGGFVLLKSYESLRLTRDADALAIVISKEKLSTLVQKALATDLKDGLWYGDIKVRELTKQGEYGAYRFDCAFQIGMPDQKKVHKLSRIHIDVSFSDRLPRKPANQVMSSLLGHEEPVTWRIYPIEYIISEKLQTFIDRGSSNSRAKDVYDLIYLLPKCTDTEALYAAIKSTFENRHTQIPSSFLNHATQFDTTILSHGWAGVKTLKEKSSFETAWEMLMRYLQGLDNYINIKGGKV